MSAIVEVRGLQRWYSQVMAVNDLSFDIVPGHVVGFVGANGAGKTTTMRIMATLEAPSAGSVRICGYDVVNFPSQVRGRIGWMPDAYGTYEHMTVYEYLDFFGRAFGFRGRDRERRIDEVMDFTDLAVIADREMNQLSKGMAQRLCLGRTLINDPEVLILDEPAAGLDPKARIDLIRLIRLLARDGKTVFISSHILSELGQMCDTLLFIDRGRLVHHGSAESLTRQQGSEIIIAVHVAGGEERLHEWAMLNPGVRLLEEIKGGARLVFDSADPEALAVHLRKMVTDGLDVTEFRREARRLEDAFISILSQTGPPPLPVESRSS